MKIPAGKNVAAVGEDERVVRRRSRFDFQNIFAMVERAAHCAVNLRHAAEAVGVLDAWIVREMRFPDLAVAQKMKEVLSDRLLAAMRARLMDAGVKCGRRALERFQSHRPCYVRDARESVRSEKCEPANSVHRLGAVEKSETFLRFEHNRF